MTSHDQQNQSPARVPATVRHSLERLASLRHAGRLCEASFSDKLLEVDVQELRPRGLRLLVRELSNGTTRFLIREEAEAGGRVRELIDCAA